MRQLMLILLAAYALPAAAMTQCPPGTTSNIFWQCVGIPVDETIAKVALYSSLETACSAADPSKATEYSDRLKQLLRLRDMWPGEELRNSADYPAALEKANQRVKRLTPAALARDCEQFLSTN